MSTENENMTGDSTGAEEGSANEELSNALAASETEFITGEEKKPLNQGLVLALVAVLAGGVMWYMYKRSGPASASGSPASAEAAKADETINTFLKDNSGGVKMMQQMLKDTEKVVKQFLEYPSATQIPLSDLKSNPFRFAKEKSASTDADAEKHKREEERAAALNAVQSLRIQ